VVNVLCAVDECLRYIGVTAIVDDATVVCMGLKEYEGGQSVAEDFGCTEYAATGSWCDVCATW